MRCKVHPMRQAIKLTRLEVEAIRSVLNATELPEINTDNKREQEEWINKIKRLKGIS